MATATQLSVQLNEAEQTAIQNLLDALCEKYTNDIKQVILFGSKARGDFDQDSDIDLLVLTEYENWSLRNDIWQMAARIELAFDVIFNVQLIAAQRWQEMSAQRFGLCQNVEQDGILISNTFSTANSPE
ncbi:MAG: nucleotidyltransferase domain-containing protein [Anaerolineales bacterium]|nr:nucleotidyltransferase domain-containing protein [Anaerolineales bacterium]